MAPPRILLCGDVLGHLNQLFKRVSSFNKSVGPFDTLFYVDQFFPDSPDYLEELMDYIKGRSQIPLPTYFIGDYDGGGKKGLADPNKDSANRGFKMDGLRICGNLYCLKGSGKFTLHGLSVAYLSGRHSVSSQQFGTYSQDDVDALRALVEEPGMVDLFLTNEWPSGVTNRAGIVGIVVGMVGIEGIVVGILGSEMAIGSGGSDTFGTVGMVGKVGIWVLGKGDNVGVSRLAKR
ncbi:Zinc finger CCCH domain-containing protein 64 [Camellia lanceoleosa]|uniref:Zinc finger CCCH domain-containing protein 64 n=1 Tax=Camellia lanceoleosa TaxID=1840588 RepID=A0ACC0IVN8_9ERIC|nr:Zinc finger CCCH domain-containing protein 64 [Camellia lanceoleosa]